MLKRIIPLIILFCAVIVRAGSITVSAAISLKDALNEISAVYEKQGGDHVDFQFGASGQLAAQIKQGAPVDVFISAAQKQVDELAAANEVDAANRKVIAGNSLVLIVPAAAKDAPSTFSDLTDPRFKKISIGDPKTVPAGDYANQTLIALKIADQLKDRLVLGENVRQVLSYVERGDVDAGIVYKTDALESGDKVKIVATADESLHKPIEYPAVIVSASKQKEAAQKFIDYLATDASKATLAAHGFTSGAK